MLAFMESMDSERQAQVNVARAARAVLLTSPGMSQEAMTVVLKMAGLLVSPLPWSGGSDAREYVSRAVEAAQAADLVVIDLDSLEEQGLAACSRIHTTRRALGAAGPRLILVGDPARADAGFHAGCDAFLPRPFSPEELQRCFSAVPWQEAAEGRGSVALGLTATRPDGTTCQGRSIELSEHGLLFGSSQPIPAGWNVRIHLHVSPEAPPLACWVRIESCQPSTLPEPEITAIMSAVFLDLSAEARSLVVGLVGVAKPKVSAEAGGDRPTIIGDEGTKRVEQWLSFLVTHVGERPEPIEVTEEELGVFLAKLPPDEQVLFGWVESTGAQLWQRRMVAIRVVLASLTKIAPEPGRASEEEQTSFVERAGNVLGLLEDSLLTHALLAPRAQAGQRTILLTLREAIELRDIRDKLRSEGAPRFFQALRRAEDYFALPAGEEPVRFDRRTGGMDARSKKTSSNPPRARSRNTKGRVLRFVVLAVVLTLIPKFVMNQWSRTANRLVPAKDLVEVSDILESGAYSRGAGPKIFVGKVREVRWKAMSKVERRRAAKELRDNLVRRSVNAAVVTDGAEIAIQIEQANLVLVH